MRQASKAAVARLAEFFSAQRRVFRLVWDAAPRQTALSVVMLVLLGILPAASIWLTRAAVNGVVAVLDAGGAASASDALVAVAPAAAIALISVISELLRTCLHLVRADQAERVRDHIAALIHDRSIAADLAFYDQPEFHDHLHRARAEAGYRPLAMLDGIGNALRDSVTLAGLTLVLIPYGAWLPVLLVASVAPAAIVTVRHTLRRHAWRRVTTPDERRAWYFDWLLTRRETAAELRLFGLGSGFQTAYRGLRGRLRRANLRLAQEQVKAELVAGSSALAVTLGVMAWMFIRTLTGLATLGDLTLFYQTFNQGQQLARSLLGNLGQTYANSRFVGDLFEFLALEPQVVDPPTPGTLPESLPEAAIPAIPNTTAPATEGPTIRFHDVSFHYPGGQRAVLERLDLEIPSGQVVAIVGPNGAGKSTLIKLLCRFYDPSSGTITMDGRDLRSLRLDDLRRRITVLFQSPVEYNASVAENIAMGQVGLPLDDPAIRRAAAAAGADGLIARLPEDYATQLGTWFEGGTELSVGEWQRIALARAYLRAAPLIILDEPTSAMDPWAEADWLGRWRRLVRGRTAIIITHRWTTARHADRIHVLDAGRIVESGTHRSLLALGGRYAQAWEAQTRQLDAEPIHFDPEPIQPVETLPPVLEGVA